MYNTSLSSILEELQMITGEVTNDVDYLVARVLQGGTKDIKDTEADEYKEEEVLVKSALVDLDEWFNLMEDDANASTQERINQEV